MNILVTTGSGPSIHSWGNMGDVAQLQAGLARLASLWPDATINVLTEWPEIFAQFCPGASPIQGAGRSLWIGEELLLGRFTRFVPRQVKHAAVAMKRTAAVQFPAALRWCLTARLQLQKRQAEIDAVVAFSETIAATDLLVASGAGGFFDSCRDFNMQTLDIVEAAVRRNIPVAMFGQNFGPLTDPDVLSRAKRILPAVDLITLRGNPGAQALLESLGVPSSRVEVTGDEAIDLAYDARPAKTGLHIGVNFRLMTSAETTAGDLEMVRPVLQQFARAQHATLIPVPIAVDTSTADYLAIRQVLRGFDDDSDGGAHLTSPRQVVEQVGRCRILVTCAYHAAVFALSQGIPVVALAKSRYFIEKFQGLEHQFGLGCQTVVLTEPAVPRALSVALETAWLSANDVRIPLQQAALRQIKATQSAYRRVKNLVDRL